MRENTCPSANKSRYDAAYAAHYRDHDLATALRGYGDVIAWGPNSCEASYSRSQILAILHRVVPTDVLLEAHKALILDHIAGRAGRSTERIER
jgi:hypothetical protein